MIETVPFTLEAFRAAMATHDVLSRRIAPAPRCVGTKRGVNYGIVYGPNGETLGRVFSSSKVAAGTNGQRRRFWTAEVARSAPSLGTRHPDRASAVRAIRAFWDVWGTREAITLHYADAAAREDARRRGRAAWTRHGAHVPMFDRERFAFNLAAAHFKRANWKMCGISAARYA